MNDDLKIDARTGDELPGLLPDGIYHGTIDGFGDIRPSRAREDTFFMQIRLLVDRHVLFSYVAGYKPALDMLKRAESFYKDKPYSIKVKNALYPGDWRI